MASRILSGEVCQLLPFIPGRSRYVTLLAFFISLPATRVGSAKVKAFTDFLFEVFDSQRRPSAHSVVGVRTLGAR